MAWNHKLSNIMRTIGAVPYMFIVFAPSLILTVFNIYFNLSVFEAVASTLDLSYNYYQKLKWFVYLSSVLLIMRPLIQELFLITNGKISEVESYYLRLMNYVGIGILAVGALAYIASYLTGDIYVNTYKTMQNPSFFQSLFGFDKEIAGKRVINGFEFSLDLFAMFASYFTETLAGFMLITSKDILFPDLQSKKPQEEPKKNKILEKEAGEMLIRVRDLANMNPHEIAKLLVSKEKLTKQKEDIQNFNLNQFDGFESQKSKFIEYAKIACKNIDTALTLV